MELLLITKNRLKIVMTSEDMKEYAIDYDEAEASAGQIKAGLKSILERAKNEVGFHTSGKGITVRIFPSKDGGCEMYVTHSPNTASSLPVPIHRKPKEHDSVFGFSSMQDLLEACRRLTWDSDIIESMAYTDREKGNCYLLLRTEERDAFGKDPCFLSVANEYGRMLKSNRLLCWMQEHCICICERDAVKILGELA